jgi:hypothetical protein
VLFGWITLPETTARAPHESQLHVPHLTPPARGACPPTSFKSNLPQREMAFDLKQVQMVSLRGQITMHSKMFAPSKAGRTAVIAAYVACPVGLGQTMASRIDAAIQRTFSSARLGNSLTIICSDVLG